jgi:hypothetical protein
MQDLTAKHLSKRLLVDLKVAYLALPLKLLLQFLQCSRRLPKLPPDMVFSPNSKDTDRTNCTGDYELPDVRFMMRSDFPYTNFPLRIRARQRTLNVASARSGAGKATVKNNHDNTRPNSMT